MLKIDIKVEYLDTRSLSTKGTRRFRHPPWHKFKLEIYSIFEFFMNFKSILTKSHCKLHILYDLDIKNYLLYANKANVKIKSMTADHY